MAFVKLFWKLSDDRNFDVRIEEHITVLPKDAADFERSRGLEVVSVSRYIHDVTSKRTVLMRKSNSSEPEHPLAKELEQESYYLYWFESGTYEVRSLSDAMPSEKLKKGSFLDFIRVTKGGSPLFYFYTVPAFDRILSQSS